MANRYDMEENYLNQKYLKLTDEKIIELVHSDDEGAIDFLMEKYKNMIRKKARTLFLIGGDKDDLIQEGMIGLYKAIRDYKEEKNTSFYTFADLCVSRQMYTAIKTSNRRKNMPLNTYISFYEPAFGQKGEEDEETFMEVLLSHKNLNPEEMIIDKESTSVLEYEIGRSLSSFEKEVLILYLGGLKYTQIAERLGKEPKSIDNALQRIKKKIMKVLEYLK